MDNEIARRVDAVRCRTGFDIPIWWLTFNLMAAPDRLDALGRELASLNAVNFENGEGGFLYPKLPTQSSASAVCALIAEVNGRAERCDVEMIAVDADTSSDVAISQFTQLIHYCGNGGSPSKTAPQTNRKNRTAAS